MRLLVVSDLHVRGADDPLYAGLLFLLRERARPGDTVVLAGDLFDLFVGGKAVFLSRYDAFLKAVREACARGVRVHYIEGNHDFQLGGLLRDVNGFQLHGHHVELTLNGKRFYVAHGDTVDQSDYGYRAMRLFFRSPIMSMIVRAVPGRWLDAVGNSASSASREARPRDPLELRMDQRERLRKVYRSYAAEKIAQGYDYVVMGHCHDLDELEFNVGGRPGQYVNVGYPRLHGSFLEWEPGARRIERVGLRATETAQPFAPR